MDGVYCFKLWENLQSGAWSFYLLLIMLSIILFALRVLLCSVLLDTSGVSLVPGLCFASLGHFQPDSNTNSSETILRFHGFFF